MTKSSHKRRFMIITPIIIVVALIITVALLWNKVYREYYLRNMYPQKYTEIVVKYSDKNNLNKNLVYAVIKCESGFDPQAHSNVDARGLMQLQPDSYNWVKSKIRDKDGTTEEDLYDPEINIKYGTRMLSELIKEFGNEETAMAAYHAGRSNVKKWLRNPDCSHDGKTLYYIPYDTTRSYVLKIENSKKIYTQLYEKS